MRPISSDLLSCIRRALASVVVLALPLSEASPQQVTSITGASTCARCRVELQRLVTLSDSEFQIDGFGTRVFAGTRGRFLVTGEFASTIGVYGSDGAFQRRIGRRGAGPGEYQQINWLNTSGDTLVHVYDFRLRRRSELHATSLRFLRSRPAPPIDEAVWISGSLMLASGAIPSNGAALLPLHVVSSLGAIQRSFGVEDVSSRGGTTRRQYRIIERSAQGFLVAPLTRYSFEYWSADLKLVRTIRRMAPWFSDSAGEAEVGHPDTHRPPPILRAVWEARDGNVWTNIGVPDSSWRPRARPNTGERPPVMQSTLEQIYDTIIEVIDPRSGTVVATQRIDGVLTSIPGTGLYWRYRDDPDRGVHLEIVKARLVR